MVELLGLLSLLLLIQVLQLQLYLLEVMQDLVLRVMQIGLVESLLQAAPANTLWKNESLTVPAAALTNQFRIRFRYTTDSSTNYYGWLIDNVKVTVPNATTWSPTTDLYTNAAATTAYTGGNAVVVYAKPSASATYTVTTANSLGCTNTGSVSLNMLTPATLGSITQPLVTCSGALTSFNLTGLLPNSTSTLSYTVNGGTTQTVNRCSS